MSEIDVEDLHPQAGIQFIALDVIGEMQRRGFITGNIPKSLLNNKEKAILRELKKPSVSGRHVYTDVQIEGAVIYALQALLDQGYRFTVDLDKGLRGIKEGA